MAISEQEIHSTDAEVSNLAKIDLKIEVGLQPLRFTELALEETT